MTNVFPCYFPTTAVLIDDNANFLKHFRLELSDDLPCKSFNSAQQALDYINQPREPLSIFSDWHLSSSPASRNEHASPLQFDLTQIHSAFCSVRRFEEISVVLVDYDMPEMNGLDVCRQIANPLVKKILFTGVADEKIAVSAFNSGLIDRFILKNEPDAAESVAMCIRDLQLAYFRQTFVSSYPHTGTSLPEFMKDPSFDAFFLKLCSDYQFVEYYHLTEPPGFLMLDKAGKTSRLVVFTEDDLVTQWEIARDQDAPSELVSQLQAKQIVPYFWQTGGFYRPSIADRWQAFTLPANSHKGTSTYYFALWDEAQGPENITDKLVAFDTYLDDLERTQKN